MESGKNMLPVRTEQDMFATYYRTELDRYLIQHDQGAWTVVKVRVYAHEMGTHPSEEPTALAVQVLRRMERAHRAYLTVLVFSNGDVLIIRRKVRAWCFQDCFRMHMTKQKELMEFILRQVRELTTTAVFN